MYVTPLASVTVPFVVQEVDAGAEADAEELVMLVDDGVAGAEELPRPAPEDVLSDWDAEDGKALVDVRAGAPLVVEAGAVAVKVME